MTTSSGMHNDVLVVDDDPNFAPALAEFIEQQGFSIRTARSLREARYELKRRVPKLLLLDLLLPDGSGLELLQAIDSQADTQIVIMTGYPTVDAAINSLRARVFDFMVKPIDLEQLKRCLLAIKRSDEEGASSAANDHRFEQLVGASPAMKHLYKLIQRVASSEVSVLIQGESGTGKELVAQAIHACGPRAAAPFLSVNCGAISKDLIGSELFGHEKGSFTGAARQHRGYFERANGGTLFLDEVTEMPLSLQVQLLRVLETGRLVRVGGDGEISVDVRIIAATNRNPQAAIEEGRLREDLFFRLAVFPIHTPPLVERRGDIPLIANYLLDRLNAEHSSSKYFSPETLEQLENYSWPGNVRELKNAVQRAFILADEELSPMHFPDLARRIEDNRLSARAGDNMPLDVTVGMPIEEAERQLIFATLKHYEGNKPKTAKALGISLKTLYNRLKQYEEQNNAASSSGV